MKKITLLLFVFIVSVNLNAQNNTEIKNSIRINGLALFTGFYELQYERIISEKNSIKIGFGTGTLRDVSGNDADKDFEEAFGTNSFNNNNIRIVKGFTINADYRYFFSHLPIPKGLYVSAGIQYLKLNDKYSYTNSLNQPDAIINNDYSIFNIRGLFGYQFIIAKKIILNPYLGAGITLGSVDENNSRVDAFGTGFSINGGIDIGIGF
ncbi:outer membrane beta-barrel protein [uncultured Polaribacter sp.]|uniref:outer membrane beta-barrel protein n=1 Tax=uncultured Polaribacter sp. TaxID=174711 RepID=UPI0026397C80|nr:outer membrane beta-barrel protein [uncultured Polaribacter sp.]